MVLSKMVSSSNKGEIASSLIILSLLALTIGTIIGTQGVVKDKINNYFSRATDDACDYQSAAQILINGRIAKDITGFSYTTLQHPTGTDFPPKSASFPDNPRNPGELESWWHPQDGLPLNYRDRFAKVQFNLPLNYELDGDTFCTGEDSSDPDNDPCKSATFDINNLTINGIPLKCGIHIEYGIQVKLKTVAPTATPTVPVSIPTTTPLPTATPTSTPSSTPIPTVALCKYYATAEVRVLDSDASDGYALFKRADNSSTDNFGVSNNKQNQTSPSNLFGYQWINKVQTLILNGEYSVFKYQNDTEGFLPEKPTALYRKGDKANVTLLGLNKTKWNINSIYCNGTGCPVDIRTQKATETISNFQVNCGVDATYGWVIEPVAPSPTVTLTPTTTLTPSPSPSPSPSPTPQEVIKCGEKITFNGKRERSEDDITHTLTAQLGPDQGKVQFRYDARAIPDRFRFEYEGTEVKNTGFRGDKDYDDDLKALEYDATVGPSTGTDHFDKNTASTSATIHVDAPLIGTYWELTLSCPGKPLPPLPATVRLTDVNNDNYVNVIDYVIVSKNYGRYTEEHKIPADINRDGAINGMDISAVIADFGKKVR